MKIIILPILTAFSFNSSAVTANPCIVIGSTVDISLIHAMEQDFDIKESEIVKSKTKMVLIDNQVVTEGLAASLAEKAVKETDYLDYDDMKKTYLEYNPRNLIVKYTYVNKEGKENIFIGSSIVNDEECSVDFNGYITVKREF
jgi:hypothetical protein